MNYFKVTSAFIVILKYLLIPGLGHQRPKLTLNLDEIGNRKRGGLGLTLSGSGGGEEASTSSQCNFNICDNIDTNQPLEKQG